MWNTVMIRFVPTVLLLVWSTASSAQTSMDSRADSLGLQLELIEGELEKLRGMIGQAVLDENQSIPTTMNTAMTDSLEECCSLGVGLRVILQQRLTQELSLWHSEMHFSVEDLIGRSDDLDVMLNWMQNSRELIESGGLSLSNESLSMLETLSSSLTTFRKVREELMIERCYFGGLNEELGDELRSVCPSMKSAGRVARAMLRLAPKYREEACRQMREMPDEPLYSLMAFWIYDGQIRERENFQVDCQSCEIHPDLINVTFLRSTVEEFNEFYLNEERLKAYTWLNDQIIETVDSSKLCPQ